MNKNVKIMANNSIFFCSLKFILSSNIKFHDLNFVIQNLDSKILFI